MPCGHNALLCQAAPPSQTASTSVSMRKCLGRPDTNTKAYVLFDFIRRLLICSGGVGSLNVVR